MDTITIAREGVDLVADVSGPEGAPTVVLLHAGGEQRTVWRAVSPHLVAQGLRTVAPDFRGHGESGRMPHYRVDDLCDDTIAIARAHASGPQIFVGGSLGGIVALLLAGELLHEVAGLVLLDVVPAPRPEAAARELERLGRARALGASSLRHLDETILEGSLVREILSARERICAAARRISVPVLLIHGRHSRALQSEDLEAFRNDMPHAQTIEVDAGHLVARDQPERVAQLTAGLVRRALAKNHEGRP